MPMPRWFVGGSLALCIVLATPVVDGATDAVDADAVLTVTRSGSGSGSVASTPGTIDCGATCSQSFTSGTQITLSAMPEAGNEFTGWLGPCTGIASCTFTITKDTTVVAGFAPSLTGAPVLDIDGDGAVEAMTDGVLALRYLFGLQGAALIDNVAISPSAARKTAEQVQGYLDDIRPALDMDGNGEVDALTDGLLMLRYLFGVRGAALVNGAIGAGATRDTAPLVEPALASFTTPPAQIPPDPTTVAPPNDETVANTLFDSTKFLYSGTPRIQTGVAPGTISFKFAAVIRGKVSARDGTPIPKVKITILSHPEFGQTYTRADGMFDMVVNGGTVYTINYAGDGYLPAQRGINIPWQQYVVAPDVVLLPLDPVKTQVTLGGALQSARGSVVGDADGTRQATVIFPPGTTASLVMPNGSTQPAPTLTVRATEYTVGQSGPNAMPGGLPPASGYTYAAEFSADEAIAAGAVGVNFSQPVAIYVENFLSFPDASQVPAGYYDRQQGKWIPQNNGRVIKVVGITAAMADLDVTGDGLADTGTDLSSIGITDAERTQLATIYTPGQSLWRVMVTHFTPFDLNWPYGPPGDAAPPTPQPKPRPGDPPRGGDPCEKAGSIIHCQTQALGEDLPIAGSTQRLHYVSDRVPGRKRVNTVSTQITGATLPPGLLKISVEVSVAGRVFKTLYDPAPNIVHTFEWDGLDAYGRLLNGRQLVTLKIGFEYLAQYYSTGDTANASYNRFGSPPIRVAVGGGGGGGGGAVSFGRNTARAASPVVVIYSQTTGYVGAFHSRGAWMGGWTLTDHHAYDTGGHNLYLGDGSVRGTDDRATVITSLGGNGDIFAPYQDGIPATQSRIKSYRVQIGRDGSVYLRDIGANRIRRIRPDGIIVTAAGSLTVSCANIPCGDGQLATGVGINLANNSGNNMGLALASDGSFYFVDGGHYIRKVDPNGILSTLAGSGQDCLPSTPNACGDGLPGRQAAMNPGALAVGPDGSVYFGESLGRVRRLGPDGVVYPFAGGANIISCTNGTQPCGDGGPATDARILNISSLAVGPDGNVYVVDSNLNRIRRVSIDGIITNFAGNGNFCGGGAACGDGTPAKDAPLGNVFDATVADDGSMLIAEGNAQRVRRIAQGIITTFAGNGNNSPTPDGDGGLATSAPISSPNGVAAASDGTVVVVHLSGTRIRTMSTTLPGLQFGEFLVAAEDGREAYIFDSAGRHLRTRDALTGAVTRTFAYDAAGRLVTMTDGDNNVTTIERAAGGDPTAIVAPGGQRTELLLDGDGWLKKLTTPAGEAWQMTYVGGASPGGLLATFTDPAGYGHVFGWDNDGLLLTDQDPSGKATTLARSEISDTRYTVTLTTNGGLVSVLDVEDLPNGDTQRIRTDPTGAQTTFLFRKDGSGRVTGADGTITDYTQAPDPRFGIQSPIASSIKVTTPGGVIGTRTATRTSVLPTGDPFSMTAQTDTVIINGKTHTTVYNAATRKSTTTSATGKQFVITLDSKGRVIDRLDDPASGQASTQYTYDAKGRLSRVQQGTQYWDYAFDAQNRQTSRTDAAGKVMTYTYDADGRRKSATTPAGRVYGMTFDLDGNPTQYSMPDTSVHTLAYTPIGLADHYTPPGGTALVTQFDANARVTSVTLPDGRAETLTYDTGGRPTGVSYPEAAIAYGYGAADSTNRITSMTRTPTGGGTAQSAAYVYDGGLVSSLTLSGSAPGKYTYVYDTSLRVGSTTFTSGADTVPLGRTWDNDGLLTTLGPFTLTRGGASANVSQIGDGTLVQAMTYDALTRLTGRTHTVNGQAAFAMQLTFDVSGRLTQKVEAITGTPHTFVYGYDSDSQLASVTRDGTLVEQYLYDANRNRISKQIGNAAAVPATYDAQDRIVAQGALAYTLTASGFLAQRGADTFSYSTTGELLQSNVGGVASTYAYDALRRRVSRTVNAATTQYFYGDSDDHGLLTHSRDGAGVLTTYYYDEGRRLFAIQRGATRYYVATDQLGSPRAVIDSSGAVLKAVEYDAFGGVVSDSAPGFDVAVGFAGGLTDPTTGFLRFGPRDYDPQSGRWTARDPVLHAGQQANLFAYVNNDPVNLLDPSGLVSFGFSICEGGCVGLKWAVTSQGLSACVDGGFGTSGVSVDIDPLGDLDKNSAAVEAKAGIQAGIAKGSLAGGFEMDDCFTIKPKGKAEACVSIACRKLTSDPNEPPSTPNAKFSIDDKTFQFKDPYKGKDTFGKPSLKVGLKICQQLKF